MHEELRGPAPLRGLDEAMPAAGNSGARPVHLWNPPFSGDIDMRIHVDGSWHYQGSPIRRKRMVELFASVLRRDDEGKFYLVTPVEKVGIKVDDAPFIAVAMDVDGAGCTQRLTFCTNVGDSVCAGPDHPLRFERAGPDDGLKPYVEIHSGLEALISRALVYDLVDLACEHDVDGATCLGVWSGGVFFPIGRTDDVLEQ